MTTEATAGLLGPSEETLETFGAASVNMKALIDYTDWGRRLQCERENYVRDLGLRPETQTALAEEINWVVAGNKRIAQNCINFREEILPASVGLCHEVEIYAQNASVKFNVILRMLSTFDQRLDRTQDDMDDETRKLRNDLIKQLGFSVDSVDELAKKANEVYKTITKFEHETAVERENDLRLNMKSVNRREDELEEHRGKLSEEVETLNALAKKALAEGGEQGKVWVPLLGSIPKRAIETKEGRAAKTYIVNIIKKPSRDTVDELVRIQCNTIRIDLEAIHDLIRPATSAIRRLQSFFSKMKNELDVVRKQVEELHKPALLTVNLLFKDIREKRWKDLERAARHYQSIAHE